MDASKEKLYRLVFLIAAVYDIALGIIFTFFYRQAFDMLGIGSALPQYEGYLSLIGAFLFVIGIAYVLIYRGEFDKNLDLIAVGTLYKLAYFSVALFHFIGGSLPHISFFYVFGVADFVFLRFMSSCYFSLKKTEAVD